MEIKTSKIIEALETDVGGKWIRADQALRLVKLTVESCAEFVEQDQGQGDALAERMRKHFGVTDEAG